MAELYKRNIRIQCEKDEIRGFMIKISDTETNEQIKNVFAATIRLNVTEINTAELTYYEVDEAGTARVGPDGRTIIHTAIAENPEIDLAALEHAYAYIGGYHCRMDTSIVPGRPHGVLTIEDEEQEGIQLYPHEALELLRWLQQERAGLEQLAKTCNQPRLRRGQEHRHAE